MRLQDFRMNIMNELPFFSFLLSKQLQSLESAQVEGKIE